MSGNVSSLGFEELIKRLSKGTEMDASGYGTRRKVLVKPIDFFKHITYYGYDQGRVDDLNDKLKLSKYLAIFDQMNNKNIPCRYCKIPFSLEMSWNRENEMEAGLITYQEFKENPEYCCLFCVSIDFFGTDIYHGFDYIDGSSDNEYRTKEIEKAGTDHAYFGLVTDKDFRDWYFIKNYQLIMKAATIEELKEILEQDNV